MRSLQGVSEDAVDVQAPSRSLVVGYLTSAGRMRSSKVDSSYCLAGMLPVFRDFSSASSCRISSLSVYASRFSSSSVVRDRVLLPLRIILDSLLGNSKEKVGKRRLQSPGLYSYTIGRQTVDHAAPGRRNSDPPAASHSGSIPWKIVTSAWFSLVLFWKMPDHRLAMYPL